MPRIFGSLSLLVITLLITSVVHGFAAGNYNALWEQLSESLSATAQTNVDSTAERSQSQPEAQAEFRDVRRQIRIHIVLGLLVALMGVLVNSLSVTYFIGTGRWTKEVTQAYELDDAWIHQSLKYKRRCFPWAMAGIMAVLVIAASGAACDPATLMQTTAKWVLPHAVASIGGTFVVGAALLAQFRYLQRNQTLIDDVVREVHGIRRRRGLPVD